MKKQIDTRNSIRQYLSIDTAVLQHKTRCKQFFFQYSFESKLKTAQIFLRVHLKFLERWFWDRLKLEAQEFFYA